MVALGLGVGAVALLSLAATIGFCLASVLAVSKMHDNEAAYFLLAHAARALLSTADMGLEGDMLPIPRKRIYALLQVLAETDTLTGVTAESDAPTQA